MTMRARVLLFAAVAMGLVALMGGALYQGATRGQWLRVRLAATHGRLDLYDQMHHAARRYLERVLRAQREGRDTQELLREHEQAIRDDFTKLEAGLREEQLDPTLKDAALQELRYIEAVDQSRRQWAEHVEQEVRSAPAGELPGPEVWWHLYTQFEQDVGPHIARAQATRQAMLTTLRGRLDATFQTALVLGVLIPLASLGLVGVLAFIILVPLNRELRQLRRGAERIGQGDFEVELPAARKDELGALARAFNRMTCELRETLQEKQRLMKAEAEAAEREFRRYNALLEQTVRTRTSELAAANTRLADSLKALQSTQAQLMFADRLAAVGRLAAGVGHEINNPLAYVLSNLSYVHQELQRSQGAPAEDERHELLTAISEAKDGAERVKVIVQDLKMLSRPDEAVRAPVKLCAVVHTAAKMASHELRNRARLVEDCQGVPPVQGNAARLGQVFLNLLINAAHAIPEGQADENEIRVVARPGAAGRITVEVSDTGCGISPEHQERIFDPFFTTKPSGQGTGLGLTVCHSIITAMGGRIAVHSQPGRGTTFRIDLPLAYDSRSLPVVAA